MVLEAEEDEEGGAGEVLLAFEAAAGEMRAIRLLDVLGTFCRVFTDRVGQSRGPR